MPEPTKAQFSSCSCSLWPRRPSPETCPSVIRPMCAAAGLGRRASQPRPGPRRVAGFQKPPPGFGVVPFFWWLGDPLTKERLGWDSRPDGRHGHRRAIQINYAHSDQGGRSYGLTCRASRRCSREDWWKLTGWFMQEAKKQGAGISLSDYTLGSRPGLVRGRNAARASGSGRHATPRWARTARSAPRRVPWSSQSRCTRWRGNGTPTSSSAGSNAISRRGRQGAELLLLR